MDMILIPVSPFRFGFGVTLGATAAMVVVTSATVATLLVAARMTGLTETVPSDWR